MPKQYYWESSTLLGEKLKANIFWIMTPKWATSLHTKLSIQVGVWISLINIPSNKVGKADSFNKWSNSNFSFRYLHIQYQSSSFTCISVHNQIFNFFLLLNQILSNSLYHTNQKGISVLIWISFLKSSQFSLLYSNLEFYEWQNWFTSEIRIL